MLLGFILSPNASGEEITHFNRDKMWRSREEGKGAGGTRDEQLDIIAEAAIDKSLSSKWISVSRRLLVFHGKTPKNIRRNGKMLNVQFAD